MAAVRTLDSVDALKGQIEADIDRTRDAVAAYERAEPHAG